MYKRMRLLWHWSRAQAFAVGDPFSLVVFLQLAQTEIIALHMGKRSL
ncbi:hypothetical protein [Nostoc sp. 'Peltigera membranacea cyanobiont' 213]|nr:hypothetical protein [Nostoc sp. 'Peltigera membranacea cyanobiont' 213]